MPKPKGTRHKWKWKWSITGTNAVCESCGCRQTQGPWRRPKNNPTGVKVRSTIYTLKDGTKIENTLPPCGS